MSLFLFSAKKKTQNKTITEVGMPGFVIKKRKQINKCVPRKSMFIDFAF